MKHDPLDRLELAAEVVARRATSSSARVMYERGNRVSLLWVHALVSTVAGAQMILWGTAATLEVVAGPHARLLMGPLGVLGGLTLLTGLTRRPRSIGLEAVGLSLIALWDLLMTLGLGYARWHQHDFRVIPLNEPLPQGYASAYPIAVYAGLLSLACVHLWTLRHLRRGATKDGEPDGSE